MILCRDYWFTLSLYSRWVKQICCAEAYSVKTLHVLSRGELRQVYVIQHERTILHKHPTLCIEPGHRYGEVKQPLVVAVQHQRHLPSPLLQLESKGSEVLKVRATYYHADLVLTLVFVSKRDISQNTHNSAHCVYRRGCPAVPKGGGLTSTNMDMQPDQVRNEITQKLNKNNNDDNNNNSTQRETSGHLYSSMSYIVNGCFLRYREAESHILDLLINADIYWNSILVAFHGINVYLFIHLSSWQFQSSMHRRLFYKLKYKKEKNNVKQEEAFLNISAESVFPALQQKVREGPTRWS